MQAFYSKIHSTEKAEAHGLIQIARATLQKVFAVRSEMAWTNWDESTVSA